jgi:hypothetical protein
MIPDIKIFREPKKDEYFYYGSFEVQGIIKIKKTLLNKQSEQLIKNELNESINRSVVSKVLASLKTVTKLGLPDKTNTIEIVVTPYIKKGLLVVNPMQYSEMFQFSEIQKMVVKE